MGAVTTRVFVVQSLRLRRSIAGLPPRWERKANQAPSGDQAGGPFSHWLLVQVALLPSRFMTQMLATSWAGKDRKAISLPSGDQTGSESGGRSRVKGVRP